MDRLPYLNGIPTKKTTLGTFGGINQAEVINENEFADMKNLSSDFFPAVGPRQRRGDVIKNLIRPHGLHYNDGLVYVDGTQFFYKGKAAGTVADTDKQMVSMGAYIIILPDKKIYNISSGEWSDMEKRWVQASQATFSPTVTASAFTKISCTGIGKEFRQGDGVHISGCANEAFNKTAVIQSREDNAIVVIGAIDKEFTQNSGLVVERKVPDMDFITESENRLWGCCSTTHEVYACKLGDPWNWNCFEGISTDSYAATIGSDGNFTGAVTHLGYVIFFKEDMLHKVYGNKPNNIQINTYPGRGVKKGCERSLCIVNETLFFASSDGLCGYDGSVPYLISSNLKKTYTEAVAGQYKGKYYVSMHTETGWEQYVYDTVRRMWHKEDGTQMQSVSYGEGRLYFVDGTGNLSEIVGQAEERMEWNMESGDLIESSLDKKKLHRLQFMLELEAGTVVDIYIRYDNSPFWERLKTVVSTQKQTVTIPLRPRRCGLYRWRLSGQGNFKLFGVGRVYAQGSGR